MLLLIGKQLCQCVTENLPERLPLVSCQKTVAHDEFSALQGHSVGDPLMSVHDLYRLVKYAAHSLQGSNEPPRIRCAAQHRRFSESPTETSEAVKHECRILFQKYAVFEITGFKL